MSISIKMSILINFEKDLAYFLMCYHSCTVYVLKTKSFLFTDWAAAPLSDPASFPGLVAAFNAPHMKVIRVSTHQGGPSLPVLRTLSGSGPIYSEGEDDSNSIWFVGPTLSRYAGSLSLTRPPSCLAAPPARLPARLPTP